MTWNFPWYVDDLKGRQRLTMTRVPTFVQCQKLLISALYVKYETDGGLSEMK